MLAILKGNTFDRMTVFILWKVVACALNCWSSANTGNGITSCSLKGTCGVPVSKDVSLDLHMPPVLKCYQN